MTSIELQREEKARDKRKKTPEQFPSFDNVFASRVSRLFDHVEHCLDTNRIERRRKEPEKSIEEEGASCVSH